MLNTRCYKLDAALVQITSHTTLSWMTNKQMPITQYSKILHNIHISSSSHHHTTLCIPGVVRKQP